MTEAVRSRAARRLRRHSGTIAGAAVLSLIALAVLFGPAVHDVDPQFLDYRAKNQGPSLEHPLGTDNLGRDTLAQMLAGGRISLAVGMAAMLLSLTLGTMVGVTAGYFHRFDGPLMRLTDLFLALPVLPLLLVAMMLFRDPLQSALGTEAGIFILIVAVIGITSWMQTARIVRGQVLAIKQWEYVVAARSIGARPLRIILLHIFPNALEPDRRGGHARHRAGDHHGERAELPGPGVSVRFSDLGPAALRRRAVPDPHAGARDLAGGGDLAD